MILFGPDYSHWDTWALSPQWSGVMLKATQGSTWVDPDWSLRSHLALSANVLMGAYHFCDDSDPTMQVAHFLRVAGNSTKVLALDVESNSSSGGTVSNDQVALMVSLLQGATKRFPLIYMQGSGFGVLPNSILNRCPLWVAHYTLNSQPRIPSGWNTWTLWQYTDTPFDTNRFNGDETALKAFWNG